MSPHSFLSTLLVLLPLASAATPAPPTAKAGSTARAGSAAPARLQDVAELRETLIGEPDEATEELVTQIAEYGTREAFDALMDGYGKMGSIYAKLLVVRVLPYFDGGEAAQSAMEHLANVATQSKDKELREAAILGLRDSHSLGGTFLVAIVESNAMVEVRELALQAHIDMGKKDVAWYKKLYQTKRGDNEEDGKKKRKKKKGDDETEEPKVRVLESIRLKAFEAIRGDLSPDELYQAAMEESHESIKLQAMEELHARGDERGIELARDLFPRIPVNARTRVVAAEIIADVDGEDVAKEFLDMASKFPTPDLLRMRMAELLVSMKSEKVDKLLVKEIAKKAKPYYKRFLMRATAPLKDEKVDKAILKSLKDKDVGVQLMAVQMIGEREIAEGGEELRELIEKGKHQELLVEVMTALDKLAHGDKAWLAELEGYLASADRDVRNAAISLLGTRDKERLLELLSHDDWSTRLMALKTLEKTRDPKVIGPIIERMGDEVGRMEVEFADVLWRLTGQPFRTRQSAWKGWWQKEGANFELPSEAELAQLAREEEERRLKQISSVKSEFFGVRIISKRVLFVLDVSGSMAWELGGQEASYGDPIRMEVARAELVKVLENLDEKTLFNLVVFSSDVSAWLDDGVAGSTGRTREEAIEYVNRLGAGGGTNIYGALEVAFEDQEVDTIVLLSDGEPMGGAVDDPAMIREDVAAWNEHRGITIHTIAVGQDLQLLEWLSEDSGGQHVTYR